MTTVCPRCGKAVSWVQRRRVGNRVYLYAVHEKYVKSWEECRELGGILVKGRVCRVYCYLGPAEGYAKVVVTHAEEFRELRGLSVEIEEVHERNLQYLEDLLRWLSVCGKRETVAKALEVIARWLPEIQKQLEALQSSDTAYKP
jgi:hypothetical protein